VCLVKARASRGDDSAASQPHQSSCDQTKDVTLAQEKTPASQAQAANKNLCRINGYEQLNGIAVKRMSAAAALVWCVAPCLANEIPDSVTAFARAYCVECHGAKSQDGDLRLDALPWRLMESEPRERWELVRDYVAEGDMPPAEARKHPSDRRRREFLATLDAAFEAADRQASVGGTPIRRLNRNEYLNSVRDLFGMRMIKLPVSFPDDATHAEFDTMPSGLFLSPAVMESYHDMATEVADRFAPLPHPPSYRSSLVTDTIGGDSARRWFGPNNEFLKFTGFNHSGWVGGLWDSLLVAPASGVYRVSLLANAQAETGADGKPFRLSFHAFDPTEEQLPKRYRLERATRVAEVQVPSGDPYLAQCEVPIESGETFHVYCDNGFRVDDYPTGDLNRSEIGKLLKTLKKRPEPTVELRAMKIEGPVAVPPRVEAFFGVWPPKLDREGLRSKLLPLAEQAYRRPLKAGEADALLDAVMRHGERMG
ncbi:MAG: DUF1587 domain-containing protein, partial [Planctomycetota bacterium]